jgi:site-specific DNA-cytosine methylase
LFFDFHVTSKGSNLIKQNNQVVHSCENVKFKQKHLQHNVHPNISDATACIFTDLLDLSSGIGECVVHQEKCHVKRASFIMIIGYSCKQLSCLSGKPVGSVLTDKTGSSGQTCAAMCEFMAAHRPALGVLENVPEMANRGMNVQQSCVVCLLC